MRHDMKDIIIDVYRRGRGYSKTSQSFRARLKRANPDNLPTFLSNRFVRNSYPNDRLAPLEKFLEKNAGRPWNDVYSEIREHCDTRSTRGQHLWEHVHSSVRDHYYHHSHSSFRGAYIDDDGILQYKSSRRYYVRPTSPLTTIPVSENVWYEYFPFINHDGKKYSVEPRAQWYRMVRTFETSNVWKDIYYERTLIDRILVPQTREVTTKRQCSKRQLKRIREKLRNLRIERWRQAQA